MMLNANIAESSIDLRTTAEQNLEHARTLVENYLQFIQRSTPTVPAAFANTDLQNKFFESFESNIDRVFDFSRRMIRAASLQEVLILQTDFMRSHAQAIAEQAKEIGEIAGKAMSDVSKTFKLDSVR